MATLKRRLHKKNAAGGYDIVHLETSAELVLRADGSTTVEQSLANVEGNLGNMVRVSDEGVEATVVIDADTLGGHAPEYYAASESLNSHISSDNPHNITAKKLGALTESEVDVKISAAIGTAIEGSY